MICFVFLPTSLTLIVRVFVSVCTEPRNKACVKSLVSLPVFQALWVNAGAEGQAACVGEETEHSRCSGEESGSGNQWHDWVC